MGVGRVELYPHPYPFSKVIPIPIPIPIGFWMVVPIPIPIGFFGFTGFIRVYVECAKCHPYSTHICIHGMFDWQFQAMLLKFMSDKLIKVKNVKKLNFSILHK